MAADGDFIEFQLIKKMYDFVCEKYKKENNGGRPFLVMFKEFDLLCGLDNIDDVRIEVSSNFVVLRKVSCYRIEASIRGKKVATAFFGLGEYNE